MPTIEVIMKWSQKNDKWLMFNAKNRKFLYDFWDCENVNKAFPGLNKQKRTRYRITIEKVETQDGSDRV